MHCFITKINQSYSLDGEDDMEMSAIVRLPGGAHIEVPLGEEQVNALIAAKDADLGLEKAVSSEVHEDDASIYGNADAPYVRGAQPLAFDAPTISDEEHREIEADPELEDMFQAEPEQDEGQEDEEAGPPIQWADLPDDLLKPEVRKVFLDMQVQPVLPANVLARLVDNVEKRLVQSAAPQKKPIGRVMPASAPRRTVPTDAHGYPVVRNAAPTSTDYDPGEIADLDEDGVAQM